MKEWSRLWQEAFCRYERICMGPRRQRLILGSGSAQGSTMSLFSNCSVARRGTWRYAAAPRSRVCCHSIGSGAAWMSMSLPTSRRWRPGTSYTGCVRARSRCQRKGRARGRPARTRSAARPRPGCRAPGRSLGCRARRTSTCCSASWSGTPPDPRCGCWGCCRWRSYGRGACSLWSGRGGICSPSRAPWRS